MYSDGVNDALRRLEGQTLQTLYQQKPFEVVDIHHEHVRIIPQDGKRKLRSILIDRIAKMAALPISRGELRRAVLQEWPDSRNTSYIAAIAHEIRKSAPAD